MTVFIKGPDAFAQTIEQQDSLLQQKLPGGAWDLEISEEGGQLELLEHRDGKVWRYGIDIDSFIKRQKSWPAPKQKPLVQAIGRKTKNLIDATAGWGEDALRFCAQGYRVNCLERQPVLALLLQDAMCRLSASSWAIKNEVAIPEVNCGDARVLVAQYSGMADCVYLDPMFPPKRKTSALANKRMDLLHRLLGEDEDASELVRVSVAHCPRTVVKRPNHAKPLWREPDQQFAGKLVRYDVYFS